MDLWLTLTNDSLENGHPVFVPGKPTKIVHQLDKGVSSEGPWALVFDENRPVVNGVVGLGVNAAGTNNDLRPDELQAFVE